PNTNYRRARRTHPPLHAERARPPLVRGSHLYLLPDYRAGFLVALHVLVGGGPTARFWHPWFGLAFAVSVFWMYKMWYGDMATTDADRRWHKAIKHYIENDDQNLPPEGRFNYGQKIFFWVMFYGVILLVISGIGLWFVESIPWSLRWLRY